MMPAAPKAEDTVRRSAPLLWVELLLEAVPVTEPEGEEAEAPVAVAPDALVPVDPAAVDPEEPVEAAPPEPPPLPPVSLTDVLTQEVEVPAWMVMMLE